MLDALLPLRLIGIFGLLLLLHGAHVHLAQVLALVEVLVERVGRVDGFVFLRCILAGVLQDDLGPAGVLGHELGDIVGAAVDDHPAVVFVVVLRDLLARELDGLRVVA